MKSNKKMMALLIASSIAAGSLTGCTTEQAESFKKVVIGIEKELQKQNETPNTDVEEEVENTEIRNEITTPTPIIEEEDPYKFNAILEEYEDGTKLVMINGEEIIIPDDVVVKYDEEGTAYLEQAPLEWHYEKKGIERVEAIRAICTVNLRNAPGVDGEKIGTLAEGQTFETTNYFLDNGWYEIDYYGTPAYVCGEYVDELVIYRFNKKPEKTFYSTSEKVLTIPGYLRETCDDEEVTIPSGEFFEEYPCCGEDSEYYLVKTSDYVGYITKDNLVELTGTFVVVDISDQNLKIYKDGEVIMDTRVVTGKPSTPTNKGIFEIYNKSQSRYLVGPTWKSYVDWMNKFDGGIGFHDAEYDKHEDGFKHGWRNNTEFGGATYLTDGSHGCVNMTHEDAKELSQTVEVGTKVLVKK